jgi:hypothetical protein
MIIVWLKELLLEIHSLMTGMTNTLIIKELISLYFSGRMGR